MRTTTSYSALNIHQKINLKYLFEKRKIRMYAKNGYKTNSLMAGLSHLSALPQCYYNTAHQLI